MQYSRVLRRPLFCCWVRNGNWGSRGGCRRKRAVSWPGVVLGSGCFIWRESCGWWAPGCACWGLKNKEPVMIAQTSGLESVKGTGRSCTQMWGCWGKRRGRNEEEEVCRKGGGGQGATLAAGSRCLPVGSMCLVGQLRRA